MSKIEKQVRDGCLSRAKKAGVLHKRMHFGHGAAVGWPDDLFVFVDGSHWWVEFKGEEGKVSPLQQHTHDFMIQYKMYVSVIRDVAAFEQELNNRMEIAAEAIDRL